MVNPALPPEIITMIVSHAVDPHWVQSRRTRRHVLNLRLASRTFEYITRRQAFVEHLGESDVPEFFLRGSPRAVARWYMERIRQRRERRQIDDGIITAIGQTAEGIADLLDVPLAERDWFFDQMTEKLCRIVADIVKAGHAWPTFPTERSDDFAQCALRTSGDRCEGVTAHQTDPPRWGARGFALQAAAYWDDVEILRLLLEEDPTARDAAICPIPTALWVAAWKGSRRTFQVLLDGGANAHARSHSGDPPLHAAAHGGHAALVELLLRRHARSGRHSVFGGALGAAAVGGDEATVRLLLEHGARAPQNATSLDSVVRQAAEAGHVEIVKMLIHHEPDDHPRRCRMALVDAARRGHLAVVEFLSLHCEHDCVDTPQPTIWKEDALWYAIRGGHLATCQFLVQCGASVDAITDNIDAAPLLHAARNGHAAIVGLLIDHHADLRDGVGFETLQTAATMGDLPVARSLLEHLVEINPRLNLGFLRLAMVTTNARRHGHDDIAELLDQYNGRRPRSFRARG
ncbi:MAG: hypothetical protein M1823_004664 [Watsoniomyces obsoletus]|nr:MAG: hypothetical protein M1823_004664 [Watsoniomyces obsoletus]